MKKVLLIIFGTLVVMVSLCFYGLNHKDEIYVYYQYHVLNVRDNIKIEKNEYFKDKDYKFVQNTDDFLAKNKNHMRNIFYTVINSGSNEFTFYCDDSYEECSSDLINLINNEEELSNINNFVHPYNSFEEIHASYDPYGKVVIKVDKLYSKEDIEETNAIVDRVINKYINDNMSNEQKIKIIHNYIINTSKYATDKYRKKYPDKSYVTALDILKNKYGICSAYSDAMAVFLNRFGIDNYKIASDSHIWNLVNVNNKWLHLDLTWDDPITYNGSNKLEEIFLLIDNDRLNELNVKKHQFNKDVYKEALN